MNNENLDKNLKTAIFTEEHKTYDNEKISEDFHIKSSS